MRRLVTLGMLTLVAVLQWPQQLRAVTGPTTKPVGVVDLIRSAADCNPVTNPHLAWLKVSYVVDSTDPASYALAKACSDTTEAYYGAGKGMRWVLGFYNQNALDSVAQFETNATAVRNAVITAGLLPYIAAVQYHEEWYGRFKGGEFAPYGLDPSNLAVGIPIVRDHIASRHAKLKTVFNLPVAWLETYANNNQNLYGIGFWHPVPADTDILIIDAYVAAGTTFTSAPPNVPTAELALQTTVATTTQPIVIMPQWFHTVSTTEMWRVPPTQDTIQRYRDWLDHPRVIAMFGFTWFSRPAQPAINYPAITGLKDMPQKQCWIKQTLGLVPTCP